MPRLKARYKAQRLRGTEGFGYYIPAINRLTHNTKESRILRNLMRQSADEVLMHHRFPTSTGNVQNACHPFSTKWEGLKHNYVLVHNGWLTNALSLEDDQAELGIRYVSEQPDGSFNDSEALVYDLALYLEGHQDALKARGAIAFVMVERDEAGEAIKLHWGRNYSSPLKFDYQENEYLTLASEGQGEDVQPNTLFTFTYATGEFSEQPLVFPEYRFESSYHYHPTADEKILWESAQGLSDEDWAEVAAGTPLSELSSKKRKALWSSPSAALIDRPMLYSKWFKGDHYYTSTDTKVPDVLCHRKGEVCPKDTSSLDTKLSRSELQLQAALDIAENELEANGDLPSALDSIEYQLIQARNAYATFKARMEVLDEALDASNADANLYLELALKVGEAQQEIEVLQKAMWHIIALVDEDPEVEDQAALALEDRVLALTATVPPAEVIEFVSNNAKAKGDRP